MKRYLVIVTGLILLTCFLSARDNSWRIAENKITAQRAEKVDPLNPLPEYPRPRMVGSEWKSLNGLCEYVL
jgi:hypothetical protein